MGGRLVWKGMQSFAQPDAAANELNADHKPDHLRSDDGDGRPDCNAASEPRPVYVRPYSHPAPKSRADPQAKPSPYFLAERASVPGGF